jgi:hypothetical protein
MNDPGQVVPATLLTEITCPEARCFSLNGGLLPVRKPRFYDLQRQMLPKIVEYARTVVAHNRSKMREPACLAVDGWWSHRRQAQKHVVDFIDCDTGLIVDFAIITRDYHCNHGDYTGSPNGMETWGLGQAISRWIGDHKVKYIVHHKDSKSGKVFRHSDMGWSDPYPETASPWIERAAHDVPSDSDTPADNRRREAGDVEERSQTPPERSHELSVSTA